MASEFGDDSDVASWGPTLERIFIDIMIDEVTKGSMQNFQFSRSTWRRIVDELYRQGGRDLSLKQVKQKFYRLHQKHREFSLLLDQPGFDWDAETNTVYALEKTWKNYIQANSHAKKFRTKGLEGYKLLDVIFNSSTSTHILHRTSTQPSRIIDDDDDDEFDDNKDSVTPASNSPNERKVRRDSRSSEISEAVEAWKEAVKARTEMNLARAERYRMTESGEGSCIGCSDEYSINKCMAVLNGLEGVGDDSYSKVLKLFKDSDWREMFMNIPQERMIGWLQRL